MNKPVRRALCHGLCFGLLLAAMAGASTGLFADPPGGSGCPCTYEDKDCNRGCCITRGGGCGGGCAFTECTCGFNATQTECNCGGG